MQSRTEQKHK